MQLSRTAKMCAAVVVVLAVISQVLIYWILWDEVTFGARGTGTQVIADLFGKKAPPFVVAMYLEYAVRGAVLLALALLVFGTRGAGSARRERHPVLTENPFA